MKELAESRKARSRAVIYNQLLSLGLYIGARLTLKTYENRMLPIADFSLVQVSFSLIKEQHAEVCSLILKSKLSLTEKKALNTRLALIESAFNSLQYKDETIGESDGQ
ncbi:MAG: hypothetical protein ACRC6V_03895 [Bacteroidales bacterium]